MFVFTIHKAKRNPSQCLVWITAKAILSWNVYVSLGCLSVEPHTDASKDSFCQKSWSWEQISQHPKSLALYIYMSPLASQKLNKWTKQLDADTLFEADKELQYSCPLIHETWTTNFGEVCGSGTHVQTYTHRHWHPTAHLVIITCIHTHTLYSIMLVGWHGTSTWGMSEPGLKSQDKADVRWGISVYVTWTPKLHSHRCWIDNMKHNTEIFC